jgi:hypothetical protein
MKLVEPAPHEFVANYLFDQRDLQPFFAIDRAVKNGGGSVESRFEQNGENWKTTLYYQDSGIVHPGAKIPGGSNFDIDSMREFRLSVERVEGQDPTGQQSFNAHVAPRWQGMKAESKNGTKTEISVPEGITEAVNVKVSGSNIAFERYQELLRAGFQSVGVSKKYFDEPHPYSNIQDAELYVRLDKNRSGPVHARSGPIAQMGHLLENDREGYRKVVQNDDTERGENLPGYYHTVTLGPRRITEAFPNHDLPKEVKHYYAREALSRPKDDPLHHPKLGVSYQVSRWDGKLGVTADALDQLTNELEEALYSVLADAGIQTHAGGGGPYVEDAYFDATDHDRDDDPIISLDLTKIEQKQESVVIKHIADGLSPVEWESLDTLVADGGQISPQKIADQNDRHPDSVRRALRRIEELVEREYGEVSLKSPHVADLVHNAVEQANQSVQRAADTAAKALEAAERGINGGTSALIAWASNHGVDLREDSEGYVEINFGTLEGESVEDILKQIRRRLRDGKRLWIEAGREPRFFDGGSYHARAEFDRFAEQKTITDIQRKSMSGFIGKNVP